MRRGYVDWAGGQIHYRTNDDGRSGEGGARTPLVLLHQTASSSAMYERLMGALAGRVRAFALDTPGFGLSDLPRESPSVSDYARAFLEALERLGLPEFHAFGHHTGASIACEMAAAAPERTETIMLCAPPYAEAEERAQWRRKVSGAPDDRAPFRQVGVRPLTIEPDGSHLPAVWQRVRDMGPDAPPALLHREAIDRLRAGERYHEAVLAMFSQDTPALLAQVRCPILLLCGDRDPFLPYFTRACNARPDARQVLLQGGSLLMDESPEAVAAEIRSFLQGIA